MRRPFPRNSGLRRRNSAKRSVTSCLLIEMRSITGRSVSQDNTAVLTIGAHSRHHRTNSHLPHLCHRDCGLTYCQSTVTERSLIDEQMRHAGEQAGCSISYAVVVGSGVSIEMVDDIGVGQVTYVVTEPVKPTPPF